MHVRIDKEPNTIEGAPWGAIAWAKYDINNRE